jgi:hypothetical protein
MKKSHWLLVTLSNSLSHNLEVDPMSDSLDHENQGDYWLLVLLNWQVHNIAYILYKYSNSHSLQTQLEWLVQETNSIQGLSLAIIEVKCIVS